MEVYNEKLQVVRKKYKMYSLKRTHIQTHKKIAPRNLMMNPRLVLKEISAIRECDLLCKRIKGRVLLWQA